MALVGTVKAVITADVIGLKKGLAEANSSLTRFSANAKRAGKSMTMKVTMPLVGLGFAAGKMASGFEFSMTQIETLVGRTTAEVDQLTESVLGLSGVTGRAPKELADAMFFITSAGLDAASATAALEASAKAAAVGLGDTAIVADAVTNAMNGYGMAADGAMYATDVLAKTVEQGKASAADLAPQFGRLIPMAAELGISFDQVGGGLAFLTRASGDAAMSATQFGGVMKSILKPSQMAKKVMESIGIDLHELRAAASKDLLGALQGLRRTLEENGLEMSNVFEDIRGLNGALQLTGVATDQARVVFDELADSTGKLDEAFEGVQKTAQFKMSQAMSEIKASLTELGGAILPVVVPMFRALAAVIGSMADAFSRLSPGMQTAAVIFGVVLAAAGPLIWVLGSITSAYLTLAAAATAATVSMSAILVPIAAIVAVGAGLFAIFSRGADDAKNLEENTDLLRQGLVDSGEASNILTTNLETLSDRFGALVDVVDPSTSSLEGFRGELVLLQGLLDRDIRESFGIYINDMDHHNALMEAGSDLYRDAASNIETILAMRDDEISSLETLTAMLGKDTEAILAAVDAGELEVDVLKAILLTLADSADAHENNANLLREDAEAYFNTAKEVDAYEAALNDGQLAVVNAMLAEGDHVRALEMVIAYAGSAEATITRLAAAEEALAGEVDEATGALTEQELAYYALMETERARKQTSSTYWEAEKREIEAVTAELEALAAAELAASRNQLRWEQRLADAAAFTAQGERDAAAAAAQAERNRISNFRTIRDLEWQILGIRQQSLEQTKGATRNVISLLRADRQVRMTEKAINQLLDERNELLGLGVDDDAQSIEQMKQQQDAITEVEQALIDMGSELDAGSGELDYLTEAQARANNITGEQAQSLRDATRAVYEAQGAYDAGYGSVIELAAAQERLADAHASIFTGAQDVEDAETRLKEIDEALTVAAEDLALQELAVNDAQRRVAASGDLAYAAAESLSAMFKGVLGPSAVGVSDDMNELARSLVEEADKVFPEFDAMRLALEGITFGMTAEQIDGYVRSVSGMINSGQGEIAAILASADPPTLEMILTRPSTAGIQAEINEMNRTFAVTGQISLPAPDTATMISDVQTALDGANLQVDVDVVMTSVDPSTAATLAWLATPEAHAFLGVPYPMADGGIVTSPMLAMIGEAGPEAVIPLGQGGMGTTNLTVNVEGSVIAEADLTEMIQTQLIKVKRRNASLQFA